MLQVPAGLGLAQLTGQEELPQAIQRSTVIPVYAHHHAMPAPGRCLLDWASPGCLGDREEFSKYTERALKMGNRVDASLDEIQDARAAQAQLGADLSQVCGRLPV